MRIGWQIWMFLFVLSEIPIFATNHELVDIPAGFYQPLFPERNPKSGIESPAQKVLVKSFKLDRFPVSVEQFKEFLSHAENNRWRRSKISRLFADVSYLKSWQSDLDPGDSISMKSPVTNVSWFAAKAYCTAQGMRLPTVAEWELAASETPADKILEWYSKPTPDRLPEVGSTFKNQFGIYDLHGLVWEWTYDFNSNLISNENRNGTEIERNLFCGGSSSGAARPEDYAAFMRFALRSSLKAKYTSANLGFRCAQ